MYRNLFLPTKILTRRKANKIYCDTYPSVEQHLRVATHVVDSRTVVFLLGRVIRIHTDGRFVSLGSLVVIYFFRLLRLAPDAECEIKELSYFLLTALWEATYTRCTTELPVTDLWFQTLKVWIIDKYLYFLVCTVGASLLHTRSSCWQNTYWKTK